MFQLSDRSLEKLDHVNHDLIRTAKIAIQMTKVDFGISEGLRSLEKQKEMVQKGVSQTMNSKHLSGDAIDIFAYVDGRISWELPYYFDIAEAFKTASISTNLRLRWGGAWTCPDLRAAKSIESIHNYYMQQKARTGQKPFIDAGHFEIYP